MNESENEKTNQPTNQPINQSINQSITFPSLMLAFKPKIEENKRVFGRKYKREKNFQF